MRARENPARVAPGRAFDELAAWDHLQSGKPAASDGFVELLVELEPVAVELVLLPLMLLLPLVVLGVSLRTCLVTASQHFPVVVVVVDALGVFVVVEVWA